MEGAPTWPVGKAVRRELPSPRPRVLRVLAVLFTCSTFLDNLRISNLRFADNLATITGLLLLVGFIGYRSSAVFEIDRRNGWFVAFLVVTFVEELVRGLYFSGTDWTRSFRVYLQYVQPVVMYVIFSDLSRDPRVVRAVGKAFIVCVTLMSVASNLGWSKLTHTTRLGREGVVGINVNLQGYIYALAVIAIFCWIVEHWPRLRWLDIGLAVAAGSMVLAAARTGSRGGAATLVIGVSAAAVVQLRRRRLAGYVVVVPIAIAAIGFGLITSEVLSKRSMEVIESGDTGARMELARGSMELFRDQPVIGLGPTFSRALGKEMELKSAVGAHNAYLQALLAFGLVGFAPWLLGLATTLLTTWGHRRSPWGGLLFALLFATTAFAAVSNLFYVKLFWLLLAITGNAGVMSHERFRDRSRPNVRWAVRR